jgi:serine protease Do
MRQVHILLGAGAASLAIAAGAWATVQSGTVNLETAALTPALSGSPASFADIVERVAPAVVSVDVELRSQPIPLSMFSGPGAAPNSADPFDSLRRFFQNPPEAQPHPPSQATGSGFFISADGYIVTNNHVVENATKVTIRTRDDRTLKARVIGRDPETDLAVLKVDGRDFPYVNFAEDAKPRVGDWVVAVGNPFNLGGTATAGIVSALVRPRVSGSSYVDYMQIDAPINRGNSGGPTFDVRGRVVGVNTAIFSPSGGSVGIGFDIPAQVAAQVAHQLIADGKVTRGYIGATVQDVTPEIAESLGLKSHAGALVADVTPGGPSARSGLRSGDIILRLDGHEVASAADLTRQVALARPGSSIRLLLRRDGATQDLIVRSDERPSQVASRDAGTGTPEAGDLGLAVAPNPGGGLRVLGVRPGSDAQAKGLRPGDVIERVGAKPVRTGEDLAQAVTAARAAGRSDVLLLVVRDGRHTFLPVDLASASG